MALEIQPSNSKWFYARIVINGKKIYQNLRIPFEGTPPKSRGGEGDAAYERSRLRAKIKHDELRAQLSGSIRTEELHQKILEARTGHRLGTLKLEEIPARWEALPRKRDLSKRYHSDSMQVLARFIAFVAKKSPGTTEMSAIDEQIAYSFMQAEAKREISNKRYNDILKLMRGCFEKLKRQGGYSQNPFSDIPTKDLETMNRIPFSATEVESIINASAKHPKIRPLVILGLSTAMRLGDCANLRWESVRGDFLDVKTIKTGKTAMIPIFPLLRQLLDEQTGPKTGLIFPNISRRYQLTPESLLSDTRKVYRDAGFGDQAGSRGEFHMPRKHGLRRASVRDFHSLRVTWVTLALNAGVPIDLVRKVTGHRTVDVVLNHYHQPAKDDFRRELTEKLPQALTGASPSFRSLDKKTIRALLVSMDSDNWTQIRDQLVENMG